MLKTFSLALVLFFCSGLAAQEIADDEEARIVGLQSSRQFVVRLNRGLKVLAKNYYKEVDEEALAAEAVRGLYLALKTPLPKTLEEQMARRADPKKPASLEDQLDDALKALDGLAGKGQRFTLLEDAYMRLGDRKLLVGHDVFLAFRAVLATFDGKASMLSRERIARLRLYQNLTTAAELGMDIERVSKEMMAPVVISTVKDGPAHRGGVRAGDRITRFDAFYDFRSGALEEPQVFNLTKLSEAYFEHMLHGRNGLKVRLALERDGKPFEVMLAFAPVKHEPIAGAKRRDDNTWNYILDEDAKIAYVHLRHTATPGQLVEIEEILAQIETQQVKGLILDLRNATLRSEVAIALADLFVEDVPIVELRGRNELSGLRKGAKGSRLRVPMACLINGESSVGVEILASCLQDQRRAAIVGERTAGEGAVLQNFPTEGGYLQMVTAYAYRPGGAPLERSLAQGAEWGVSPDAGLVVELTAANRDKLRRHLIRHALLKEDAAPADGFVDAQRDAALRHVRSQLKNR